jgi:indole-3-glycerol phosphate synthase
MTTAAPDLLAAIVAGKRRIVEIRRSRMSEYNMELQEIERKPNGEGLLRALRETASPRVIAECKRRSPSRGILRDDYRPVEHARAYADAGAAAISVLTEPTFFDGSLEHLAAIRSVVRTPLLRKDFIVSRYQILEAVVAGADAVLLIVGALSGQELGRRLIEAQHAGVASLVEVHDESELERAIEAGATLIGVNSRNLRTLGVEPELHERLARRLPSGVTAVAESGLKDATSLARLEAAGYSAFLVGERLIVQPDPGSALRTLRGQS